VFNFAGTWDKTTFHPNFLPDRPQGQGDLFFVLGLRALFLSHNFTRGPIRAREVWPSMGFARCQVFPNLPPRTVLRFHFPPWGGFVMPIANYPGPLRKGEKKKKKKNNTGSAHPAEGLSPPMNGLVHPNDEPDIFPVRGGLKNWFSV